MDYSVGDLVREKRRSLKDLSIASSWRDYGVGLIIDVDLEKKIAKIYWFEVGVSSFYKFRNMQLYLTRISCAN
tara:strand:+ start:336 stop:554 length:219 start_codon:yes stop_codon:yes gene_type:complete